MQQEEEERWRVRSLCGLWLRGGDARETTWLTC